MKQTLYVIKEFGNEKFQGGNFRDIDYQMF